MPRGVKVITYCFEKLLVDEKIMSETKQNERFHFAETKLD